jgi:hypothetical protein
LRIREIVHHYYLGDNHQEKVACFLETIIFIMRELKTIYALILIDQAGNDHSSEKAFELL